MAKGKRTVSNVILRVVACIIGIPVVLMVVIIAMYAKSPRFKGLILSLASGQEYNESYNVNFYAKDITKEKSIINDAINVAFVQDPDVPELKYYKVSGMQMDYYIMENAYGKATGHMDYENTINGFFSSLLIDMNLNNAEKYITKADKRALEDHENADEEYQKLLQLMKETIEYVKPSDSSRQ